MSAARHVTVERMDAASALAERAGGLSLKTSAFEQAPAGGEPGLKRYSLSRHDYGPSSPCATYSPRVGELWRTGQQTSAYGGFFRPSPSPKSPTAGVPPPTSSSAQPGDYNYGQQ